MKYTTSYQTPLGQILLAADETGLTGLWFEGAKHYAAGLDPKHEEKELPVFGTTRKWLDLSAAGFSAANPYGRFSVPGPDLGDPSADSIRADDDLRGTGRGDREGERD